MIDYTLYLVTDTELCGSYGVARTVAEAISGGVTIVQVRDPQASDEAFLRLAREVVEIVEGAIPVLLNDRVHLVADAGADGAHIGQQDLAVQQAREILGPDRLLGLSVSNAEQLAAAAESPIDYLGFGPVWPQRTKLDAAEPLGLDGLARLVIDSPVPSVAIGGIKATNLADIKATGVHGAAVVSAICGQPDPAGAAQLLRKEWA